MSIRSYCEREEITVFIIFNTGSAYHHLVNIERTIVVLARLASTIYNHDFPTKHIICDLSRSSRTFIDSLNITFSISLASS